MDNLVIVIKKAEDQDEDGFFYDIYDEVPSEFGNVGEENSLDGGFCTGSMLDAMGMALSQAKEIIKKYKKDETA